MHLCDLLSWKEMSRNEMGQLIMEEQRFLRLGKPINPHENNVAKMHILCPLLVKLEYVELPLELRVTPNGKEEFVYHLSQKGLDALKDYKSKHHGYIRAAQIKPRGS